MTPLLKSHLPAAAAWAVGVLTALAPSSLLGQIVITKSATHQQIDGFGATAGLPTLTLKGFTSAQSKPVLDFLFGTTGSDLGLSIVRLQINPYQASDPVQVHSEQASIEQSKGSWTWDQDPHQVWFAQQAANRNVTRFYALPWSPPVWMKTPNNPGDEIGGMLNSTHYQDYATYFEKYIVHYGNGEWSPASAPGIPISWLALQNEPNIDSVNYACCGYNDGSGNHYTGLDYGTTVKNVVADLKADFGSMPVKINGPEASNTGASINYLKSLDSTAMGDLDLETTHNYDTAANGFLDGLFNQVNSPFYPATLWMTENCKGGTPDTGGIVDAMDWADEMYTWLQGDSAGAASAYLFFWCVNDEASPNIKALVNIASGGAYTIPTRAYAFGQFSRFVRPGYFQIGSSAGAPLKVVTFYDKTDQHAVVVVLNDDPNNDYSETVAGFSHSTSSLLQYRTSGTSGENLKNITPNPAVANGVTGTIKFPRQSVTTLVEQMIGSAPAVPGAPSGLAISKQTLNTEQVVTLTWTNTGASNAVGVADYLDIRWIKGSQVTDINWSTATPIKAQPPGMRSGDAQTFIVGGLASGTYYFGMKAVSQWGTSAHVAQFPASVLIQ